jgi:hypothetical protein
MAKPLQEIVIAGIDVDRQHDRAANIFGLSLYSPGWLSKKRLIGKGKNSNLAPVEAAAVAGTRLCRSVVQIAKGPSRCHHSSHPHDAGYARRLQCGLDITAAAPSQRWSRTRRRG